MLGGRRDRLEASGLEDIYIESPRRPGKPKADDRSGDCATCGSEMHWPRSVSEFRCTICLMINDLDKTSSRSHGRGGAPAPPQRGRTESTAHQASFADRTKAIPISINRTKPILDNCIDSFLESRRGGDMSARIEQLRPTPPDSPDRRGRSQPPEHLSSVPVPTRARSPLPGGPQTPPETAAQHKPFAFDGTPRNLAPPDQRATPNGRKPSFGQSVVRKPLPPGSEPLVMRPAPAGHSGDAASRSQPPPQARRGPPDLGQPQFIPASRIFKPLENFLARHLGDQETLNASFFTAAIKPHPPAPVSAPSHSTEGRHGARHAAYSQSASHTEPGVQDLDAKTLLLGDIAENSTWWTGQVDTQPSASQPHGPDHPSRREPAKDQIVDKSEVRIGSRSPMISWAEVQQWYDLIVSAGIGWQQRARQKGLDQLTNSHDIATAMQEGREHLHRAVLKISESLLKRPGRQLKVSGDIRFLLILLANPLLYPENAGPRHFGQLGEKQTTMNLLSPPQAEPGQQSMWDQGNAFGIIKRIFGLLANMPPDCHRHLHSWFSRYDELMFRSYVDLVQRFMTHRLRRQHGRKRSRHVDPVDHLIPTMSGTSADTSAQLHAALGFSNSSKANAESQNSYSSYKDDWQVKSAAKIMALLFSANKVFQGLRSASTVAEDAQMSKRGSVSRTYIKNHGQLLSTTEFYNSMVDVSDPVNDFDKWELDKYKTRFSFCEYPFFLSVGTKIKLIQHDSARQMEDKAREIFFSNVANRTAVERDLTLRVRRDCLVDDSLKGISGVTGQDGEIKKGLKIQFVGEEGIDAGGIRKEWFLSLSREIFNPQHGLFLYDDESPFCYFNPWAFETSDRFYLVGAVLGLAVYNSTILDVALPRFLFKKLLIPDKRTPNRSGVEVKSEVTYTLKDLAEYKPSLARGLRQLLEYDGNVQETFQRDFVIEVERYGTVIQVPLCKNGDRRAVTNRNRAEFVERYIRYLLDEQVERQYEPFKRGFITVAGGNALSLFQPEEIELLVRGSDEPLDVPALRAVAEYENWRDPRTDRVLDRPDERVPLLHWFWELFERADPGDQRKLLAFVTGSDRVPAMGAASLVIRVAFGGNERNRLPIARTCFNQVLLYDYRSREEMAQKLWMAVLGSEGFGLK